MIRMPKRNVTRFFIPLIDVLILLFCIFLLMEFNSDSEVNKQDYALEKRQKELDIANEDFDQLKRELREFEEDRPKLLKIRELEKELERLKNASQQSLQKELFAKVIDVNEKGEISFYDEDRKADFLIKDKIAANELIERHAKEAKEQKKANLYYYFKRTRPSQKGGLGGRYYDDTLPEYRVWFARIANNLPSD